MARTQAEDAVLATLQKGGGTLADIASKMGIRPSAITKALGNLQKKGEVTKDGEGWWKLADNDDTVDTSPDRTLAASRELQKKQMAEKKAKAAAKAKAAKTADDFGEKAGDILDKVFEGKKKASKAAPMRTAPKGKVSAPKAPPTQADPTLPRGSKTNIAHAQDLEGPGSISRAHKVKPRTDKEPEEVRPWLIRNITTGKVGVHQMPVLGALPHGEVRCPSCGMTKDAATDFSRRYSLVIKKITDKETGEETLVATHAVCRRQSQCRKCRGKKNAERRRLARAANKED